MRKVIVGLSGGVDSSVSALRLRDAGFEVHCVFMKNWEEDDTENYCAAAEEVKIAEQVCQHLHLPFTKINFAAEYWDSVFENFLSEYAVGRTPNPDILCNKEIKFKAFLDYAALQGADYIATGHYARIRQTEKGYELLKGLDPSKDQSYFLYTLGQTALSKSLFPVGDLKKTQVRQIAQDAGLENSGKKDSTGICFIGERRFKTFLSQYLPAKPGKITTPEGQVLGEHQGLMFYTLGQRQGIGVGGKKGARELPWYVVQKKMDENILVVSQDRLHPLLLSPRLVCGQMHWVSGYVPDAPLEVMAKIRYRAEDEPCKLSFFSETSAQVEFKQAPWAAVPGQSIVFYDGEICLGGGIIEQVMTLDGVAI